MRVVTWNLRRATEKSAAWKVLVGYKPDIALLQEVASIPIDLKELFDIQFRRAIGRTGKLQQFGTAVIVKGKIVNELLLSSAYDWVNQELKHFAGNLMSYVVQPIGHPVYNIVSVHSPAWPVDTSKFPSADISTVKLKQNPRVWVHDILWAALKNANLIDVPWIVGGDLNSSETFDLTFGSGNRENLERIEALGFTECLRKSSGKLTPTFLNLRNGKLEHQIDHLFATNRLYSDLRECIPGDKTIIFGEKISDHLPIIADFENIHSS